MRTYIDSIIRYSRYLATYFGASIIPLVLNLVSNPFIAKNMDPDDYAISGYYTSFNTLISPIIVFYLVHYYIKEYFKVDDACRDKLLAIITKALIWFSGVVSVICFLFLLIYLKYIKTGSELPISPYLALSVFALPLTGLFNLRLAQYRMGKKSGSYFKLSVCHGILTVLFTVVLVVIMKYGAIGKLLGPLLCNAIFFIYLVFQYKETLKIKTNIGEFKNVFVFCLPLASSAMLGYFTNGFSTTYLESLGQTTEYGIYIVGASIGNYLIVFSTAIGNVFQPDIYESTIKKQWNRYMKLCITHMCLIILVAVAYILLAPYIISLLTANRYISSTPYSQIISLSIITSGAYFLINNYTIVTNRPKLYLYTTIIGSLFIIIVLPIMVKYWGFFGGAWMSVISYIVLSAINLVLLLFVKNKPDKLIHKL